MLYNIPVITPSVSENSFVCKIRGNIHNNTPIFAGSNHPYKIAFVCHILILGEERYSISPIVGITYLVATSKPKERANPMKITAVTKIDFDAISDFITYHFLYCF